VSYNLQETRVKEMMQQLPFQNLVPEKGNLLEQDRWWELDPSWYQPVHKNPQSLRVNSSFLFLYVEDQNCGIVGQLHPNH
jgi:hypothetical protein